MKQLIAVLILIGATCAAAAQETRIAAVVNSDIVTIGEVAARTRLLELSSNIPDTPENRQRLAPQVLRSLIDEKLQTQEAKRLSIAMTPAEIDKAVGNIEQRNNLPKGGLDEYFAQHGVSRSTFIEQITASLVFAKIVQNRLSQDVNVTDEEVNDAMKRLQADIGKPQNRIAELFLAVDNPSQEDEVRQLADRLIEQIRGGANFATVAQQFSQSPSAAVGGDIGWATQSELSPRLAAAIERMNPGQMSFPVRTPSGFYVLYLMDRRTLGAQNPDQIVLSLTEVVFPLPPSGTPEDQKKVEDAARQVSSEAKSCGEMAKLGAERAPQLSRQIPQIRASDLPADIRQPILALKIAEASKPLPLSGGIGVVMVCERKEPPGLPTRDEVGDTMAREKLDTLARRYMRDLRRGAYIDIRG